jgi:hypothetical protein
MTNNEILTALSSANRSLVMFYFGVYFESGYLGRGFRASNIQNCDSMSDSLDFLSPEMDQNYPKASIAIIAIKRFSLLYNFTTC